MRLRLPLTFICAALQQHVTAAETINDISVPEVSQPSISPSDAPTVSAPPSSAPSSSYTTREIVLATFTLSFLYEKEDSSKANSSKNSKHKITETGMEKLWEEVDPTLVDVMLTPVLKKNSENEKYDKDYIKLKFETESSVIAINNNNNNSTALEEEEDDTRTTEIRVRVMKRAIIMEKRYSDHDTLDAPHAKLSVAFGQMMRSYFLQSTHSSLTKVHKDFDHLRYVKFVEFEEHEGLEFSSMGAASSSSEKSNNDAARIMILQPWTSALIGAVAAVVCVGIAMVIHHYYMHRYEIKSTSRTHHRGDEQSMTEQNDAVVRNNKRVSIRINNDETQDAAAAHDTKSGVKSTATTYWSKLQRRSPRMYESALRNLD